MATEILTIYKSVFINGKEYSKLVAQGIYTNERLQKFKDRAKKVTFEFIEKGQYLNSMIVLKHPQNTRDIFKQKFEIPFN